jgi:hypothetical protein
MDSIVPSVLNHNVLVYVYAPASVPAWEVVEQVNHVHQFRSVRGNPREQSCIVVAKCPEFFGIL